MKCDSSNRIVQKQILEIPVVSCDSFFFNSRFESGNLEKVVKC